MGLQPVWNSYDSTRSEKRRLRVPGLGGPKPERRGGIVRFTKREQKMVASTHRLYDADAGATSAIRRDRGRALHLYAILIKGSVAFGACTPKGPPTHPFYDRSSGRRRFSGRFGGRLY
jgi:hypothetical protein